MGIDLYVFNYLLNFRGQYLGDTLCLGRQSFNISPLQETTWSTAQQILSEHAPGEDLVNLIGEDNYSEKFLHFLGSQTVASLDYSSFEGAGIVHDLNFPIEHTLERKFDFILDGGTLEHIYSTSGFCQY